MSDFPLDSPQEPLSWEQRQTGYDDGETDDAGLEIDPAFSFPWPEDPNERTIVPITMSLNEYTALLSAVDVGAAIAWTNDALKVYYILVRSLKVPPMAICEQIIECIEGDTDVQDAIADMLSNYLYSSGDSNFGNAIADYLLANEAYLANLGEALAPWLNTGLELVTETTTDDEWWAICVGIARYSNTVIADFLEVMEVNSDVAELMTKTLNSIPVLNSILETVGVTEWLDTFDWLQEVFVEQYTAGWTETIGGTMYKFSCALYCKTHPTKVMTFDSIIETCVDLLGEFVPVDLSSMVTLLSSVIGVTDEGEPTVWASFMFAWGLARFSSIFGQLRINNKVLRIVVKGASEQSEGSFDDYCEDCPEPLEACVNFLLGRGTYMPASDDVNNAQYTEEGWAQENNTYLTLWGLDYDNINKVTLLFNSEAWSGADDYHKFFVTISNIDASNLQTFGYFALYSGPGPHEFTTTGSNWMSLRIQISAGGLTYPPNGSNTTPTFLIEACVDPAP